MQPVKDELVMEVQLTVIDHLGINMYTSLPPVISELVANSWDADASNVNISIPETDIDDTSEIIIRDNGAGMTYDEINAAYLKIGRNRRNELKTDKSLGGRKILGRKGLGKLSVFGVAKKVEIQSVKNGEKVIFEMDIDAIKNTTNGKYQPNVLLYAPTTDPNGLMITLKKLKRKQKISLAVIRRGLAQRFSVIDRAFDVFVNRVSLTVEERNLKRSAEHVWTFNEEEIKAGSGLKVSGWIGTLPNTARGDIDRGIIVLARGKLVQEPTLFGVTGGKELAYSYMVGEIAADFFDSENDLIATYRSSIVWESEEGQIFKDWVRQTITKISYDWSRRRIESREKVVREDPDLKKWLLTLSTTEKKIAGKVIRAITADENLPEVKILELANFMKDSFEFQAFRDLASQISENPTEDDGKLINLFYEWQFLESKEMLRVVEGRLATIKKFQEYINTNAREVPTIHNFLKKFPWVLDPRWTNFRDEVYYSTLLKENFPDEDQLEENRRIDFICTGSNDTINIIELKRPEHPIGKKDLDQIRDYIIFIRRHLGTDSGFSYNDAAGYLVAGKRQESADVKELIDMCEKNRIYVRHYGELFTRAENLHKEFIDQYDELKSLRDGRNQT